MVGRKKVLILTFLAALAAGAAAVPGRAAGQTGRAAGQTAGADSAVAPMPLDTAELATGPHSRACMLLEKTIFNVDVLTLELRFGPATTSAIRRLARSGASRDSIASAALQSRNAFARIEFRRDIGMDRFIEGVREDLHNAAAAGVVSQATVDTISGSLPEWYGFLKERGVREGDRLVYRIRGDTLRSGYRAVDGDWLMEQTDVGAGRRLAVLGSYLAPGSSFQKDLVDRLRAGKSGC